jgi:hypothetical protein
VSRLNRWARRLLTVRGRDTASLSLAHVGLTYGASVALYGLGGWWLDGKLGTSPLFLLIGVGLGAIGGFLWVYREVVRVESQAREKKAAEAGEREGESKSK